MESAIQTLVTTFLTSSKGRDNLESKNFQKMVSTQLGSILEEADCSSAVKEMQQGLDANNDGKVNFQEYLKLIGYLAKALSQRKFGSPTDAS